MLESLLCNSYSGSMLFLVVMEPERLCHGTGAIGCFNTLAVPTSDILLLATEFLIK